MSKLIQLLRNNVEARSSISTNLQGEAAHIFLKGVISADFGVGAADLRAAFDQAAGVDAVLHINSPGGDAFEGREMQAVIAGYSGKVTAVVEGLAASSATIVSMAANEVHMLKGSRYMIHNGMTIAMGNRHDMKSVYDLLAGFDAELAADYAKHAGGDVQQMAAWMDAETWFTAEQALEHGFVHQLLENTKAAVESSIAAWNLSAYANAPKPEPEPGPDWAAVMANNRRRLSVLQLC